MGYRRERGGRTCLLTIFLGSREMAARAQATARAKSPFRLLPKTNLMRVFMTRGRLAMSLCHLASMKCAASSLGSRAIALCAAAYIWEERGRERAKGGGESASVEERRERGERGGGNVPPPPA